MNVNELTEHRPRPNQTKFKQPLQSKVRLRGDEEFTDNKVEKSVTDGNLDFLVKDAPAANKQLQSAELSKITEKIEDLNRASIFVQSDQRINFEHLVKEAPAEGVL